MSRQRDYGLFEARWLLSFGSSGVLEIVEWDLILGR